MVVQCAPIVRCGGSMVVAARTHGSRAVQRTPITRVPRACVGAESQWILFIHNTTSALKAALFFFDALIFPLISRSWLGPSPFHSVVGRPDNLFDFFFHWRRTNFRWPRPRSSFYFFHILVFRSKRFVNKFSDNETERFVTSSRLV